MNILFLVSGGGGNLRFVFHAINYLSLDWKIRAVLADRDCGAVDFAREKNIYTKILPYSVNNDSHFNEELGNIQPDIVITNIHKILSPATIASCSFAYMINLHYSLLPAWAGLIGMKPVIEARKINSKIIGVSTHKVIEKVDAGSIIAQAAFVPDWKDMPIIEDTVFKIGAMTLLSTLFLHSSEMISKPTNCMVNDYEICFSDYYNSFEIINTERFWEYL